MKMKAFMLQLFWQIQNVDLTKTYALLPNSFFNKNAKLDVKKNRNFDILQKSKVKGQ